MSQTQTHPITASLVAIEKRPEVFFQHFGPMCISIERHIYTWMRNLCPTYNGGFWEFSQLSNGGFFMEPCVKGPLYMCCLGNGFDGSLSSQAAGIVACLFAYSHLSHHDKLTDTQRNTLIEHFHSLRNFAGEHPEAALIFAAID